MGSIRRAIGDPHNTFLIILLLQFNDLWNYLPFTKSAEVDDNLFWNIRRDIDFGTQTTNTHV